MRARMLVACLVIACANVVIGAQSPVTRYDLAGQPIVEIGSALRIKKIMGEVGTFMLGTFAAGWKNTPHHHTHDQINIGVLGQFHIVTPTAPHLVARLRGLMIPPDAMHGNDVTAEKEPPFLIEFQPVRRVDFPPEREKIVFPRADRPTAMPDGADFDFRRESPTWRRAADGVRVNARKGRAAALSAWDVTAAAQDAVTLQQQLAGSERFIYLLEGGADMTVGGDTHSANEGVVWVVAPGAPDVQVRANGGGTALLLVFEAIKP